MNRDQSLKKTGCLSIKYQKSFLSALMFLLSSTWLSGIDYYVTGTVTDAAGKVVPDARISMFAGNAEFAAISGTDGSYSLRISGIYGEISGLLQTGIPYPNPFTYSVNIPFIINTSGDVRFSVYSLSGQKIKEVLYTDVEAGSYRIVWDGCNDNGAPVKQGFYIYAITFKGKSWSGRLIKVSGPTAYSSVTTLEPIDLPSIPPVASGQIRIPVITTVICRDFYPTRLTDIVIRRDTVIDFEITAFQSIPFRTQIDHIAMFTGSGYRPLNLKGINLGSSPPGTFPGEIAYAISGDLYRKWISRMAEAGFNSLRVYTLHPPVFYEELANYNYRHPDKPLLLFQGIWLGEVEDGSVTSEYDLVLRTSSFRYEIREIVDCLHGNNDIAFRLGRAYGNYDTDISRWTAGYVLGREIMPQEVDTTNKLHQGMTSFTGNQLSITGGTASEVFVTQMLDETVSYENQNYSVNRPVSISSWPTLDPLDHPTEIFTDEDKATYDITKINQQNLRAGLFACYHAYPYYPNFISEQPSYQSYTDEQGANSYLGYLTDLKNHYAGIPLVIGEFGVPSSWSSAHQSFSNMDHGGYSEQQQGEKNIRMMHNIIDAGCAGGFMFSWMDEWFKPTWIVAYLEAYGFDSNGITIPTRQLWHNLLSPEQNFGLITFDQESLPYITYNSDNPAGPVTSIKATYDNSQFYLNVELSQSISAGDTLMIAFDTYSAATGESQLPNGKVLSNRSEFLLSMVAGNDTADFCVTEAYDMKGFTPRFNLTDPAVQKYRSTVTDGASWNVMVWINDGFMLTEHDLGSLPVENAPDFTFGHRCTAAWSGNMVKIRVPWTMLYFNDPTQMKVNDGAISNDGGNTFDILTTRSDGIAISVYNKGIVTSTTSRYNWDKWLVVPSTIAREKKSLQIVEAGLAAFAMFAD